VLQDIVSTGPARKKALLFAVIFITAALTASVVFIFRYQPPYTPPPFESGAMAGIPEPPEGFGYGEIDAMGSFAFGLAGVMYQQEDGSLRLYFTNPEENEAYLMCEIVDTAGKTLYKSGLIRPGEYVISLYPVAKQENKAVNIEVKIYAFDPEFYYSLGTVTLDNILQPY
jgi:hypothetical protein